MNNLRSELRRNFWRDAAVGGGLAGLVVVICDCLPPQTLSPMADNFMSLVEIVVLVFVVYKMLRKRSNKYANLGFSYGQAVSYVMAMMLFAGFLVGVGLFLLVNNSEAVYSSVLETALESSQNSTLIEGYDKMLMNMMETPFYWIVVGIIMMGFYGGFIGLFISPFVKRPPVVENIDSKQNE